MRPGALHFTGGKFLLAMQNGGWPVLLAFYLVIIGLILWLLAKERKRSRQLAGQLELHSQQRKVAYDFLHDMGEAFTEGIHLDQLLAMIAKFSVNTTQAGAGAIFLFDRDKKNLRAEVVIGAFPPPLRPPDFIEGKIASRVRHLEQVVKSQTISVGEGLIGEVAGTGKPILIQDGFHDARLVQYDEPALKIRTAIFMPLKFRDEVLGVMVVVNKQAGEFSEPFHANDLFLLDALTDHAAVSLHNLTLYAMQSEKQQFDTDLRVAGKIQRSLLPNQTPQLAGFDIAGLNHPARQVGGDYYDFIPLVGSRLGVVIADVSGKAVAGALVMSVCRTILRAQCSQSDSPAEVLRHVNKLVVPDLSEDMFVTLLYGILDGAKRTFTFARAGHDPVLWLHATTRNAEIVAPKGIAVGLNRAAQFNATLEERELALAPGDVLTLYTDGITESLDAEEKEFGREQLIEAVKTAAQGSAEEISRSIFERLRRFTGDEPLEDDRTLIVIKAV